MELASLTMTRIMAIDQVFTVQTTACSEIYVYTRVDFICRLVERHSAQ